MPARPLRADARHNRDRLIEAARSAFAVPGASPALEEIARTAGVGIGTLYRHFPTREELYLAVYRADFERTASAADDLLREHEPRVALRRWMRDFVDFITAKHGMADAFHLALASSGDPEATRAVVTRQIAKLVSAAAGAGIRQDADPLDIMTMLTGIALTTRSEAQTERLIDLAIGGLSAT